MKFLVDMQLSPALAERLRKEGHDAVHAHELGLHAAPDRQILDVAENSERVIVTADLDFPRLFAIMQKHRPGLILLRNGKYSEAESLACLLRVLMVVSEEELMRSIVVVDSERIRRRRLPVVI